MLWTFFPLREGLGGMGMYWVIITDSECRYRMLLPPRPPLLIGKIFHLEKWGVDVEIQVVFTVVARIHFLALKNGRKNQKDENLSWATCFPTRNSECGTRRDWFCRETSANHHLKRKKIKHTNIAAWILDWRVSRSVGANSSLICCLDGCQGDVKCGLANNTKVKSSFSKNGFPRAHKTGFCRLAFPFSFNSLNTFKAIQSDRI